MKKDIILSGVGGQGILSISAVIGFAAIEDGLHLKQAEVHGMSQRGGDVHSNLRISDKEIASDLIPQGKADMIISVEPMESLRYLHMLSPEGWLVTNSNPFVNIPNYPDIDEVIKKIETFPNHIIIDAEKIAGKLGSKRSANIVILGAASQFLNIEFEKLEKAIKNIFKTKGEEIINLNLKALEKGREFAENYIKN